MKKLIVFVILLGFLATTALFKMDKFPLFDLPEVDKVCFVSGKEIDSVDDDIVHCGDLVFNFCSLSVAKENLDVLKEDLKAVQFYFLSYDENKLLKTLQATIVSRFQDGDLTVISAYTPLYQDCVFVNDKKVNCQIVYNNQGVIAGFPAILTGY